MPTVIVIPSLSQCHLFEFHTSSICWKCSQHWLQWRRQLQWQSVSVTVSIPEIIGYIDNRRQWHFYLLTFYCHCIITYIGSFQTKDIFFCSTLYRVTHLLANLGWFDLDLGCSTILPSCSASSAKFPSAQAEPGRGWNSQNPSQQNPVSAHFGTPCRPQAFFFVLLSGNHCIEYFRAHLDFGCWKLCVVARGKRCGCGRGCCLPRPRLRPLGLPRHLLLLDRLKFCNMFVQSSNLIILSVEKTLQVRLGFS